MISELPEADRIKRIDTGSENNGSRMEFNFFVFVFKIDSACRADLLSKSAHTLGKVKAMILVDRVFGWNAL